MCMRETASPYVSVGSACAAGCKTSAAPPGAAAIAADAPNDTERRPFFICGSWQAAVAAHARCQLFDPLEREGGAHSGLSAMLMSFMGLSSAATRLALSAPQRRQR